MGSGHLSNYLRLMREGQKVQLVAVCDVRPEQMERKDNADLNIEIQHETFEAHYNKYTNYLEMLDKEDLDYVDFAVPTYLHAKLAIQALETGHHVLSEKPMAMTVQGVRADDRGLHAHGQDAHGRALPALLARL